MADDKKLSKTTGQSDVEAFLRKVASTPASSTPGRRGRLIFAMDATASREPTWDGASHIQAEMFQETATLGGLDVQLAYYRGFRDFRAGPWIDDPQKMLKLMTSVRCLAGHTQVIRVLKHTIAETKRKKVNALVFVGDCIEEDIDQLGHLAGQMGILGVPAFIFHEGHDVVAARAFQQIARLSNGAYCPFDAKAPGQLRDLLSAVAVYAAGGRRALSDYSSRRGGLVRQLTHQLK